MWSSLSFCWMRDIFYDETGYLRSGNRSVRRLFHQLNQAKEELAFVVKRMRRCTQVILGLLQAM